MNDKKVKLEEFFDFDKKKPINRLAYTKEDMDYKIKVIQKMQELGMKITIDKAGNICGSISIGKNPQKTIAIGSHTDSVYDGGQYDGPVGVITGLDMVEQLLKSKNKDINGIIKVAIYACEESSRFGNACIGSKFLNGNIKEEDFKNIFDQNALKQGRKVTLKESIQQSTAYLKSKVPEIKEVDKIFDEVDYSLEAHIEQYETLHKQSKKQKQDVIGIVNSIGSAVRVKYDVYGESGHTGSTPMKKRKNAVDATAFIGKKVRKLGKIYEKEGLGRASQVEINTINHGGSFNQLSSQAQGLIDFRILGESTPEKVLEKFEKITKKTAKKTKTKIETTVVSKGNPIITSKKLNNSISNICNQNGIKFIEMPSWAGQDTGYIPAKNKTMIFIPSTGGSHNPKESTKRRYIELASNIFANVTKELLTERFQDIKVTKLEKSSTKVDKRKQKSHEMEL